MGGEASMSEPVTVVEVNRAPVLTLWAAVIAEQLGFDRDEALTLGRAVAGLNAHTKGVALGIFTPAPKEVNERRQTLRDGESLVVDLLRRAVPAVRTPAGIRALSKDQPIKPESVELYLAGKFGAALDEVRSAMVAVARSLPAGELARCAFELYERFRPKVAPGEQGWGATGILDLAVIRALASRP